MAGPPQVTEFPPIFNADTGEKEGGFFVVGEDAARMVEIMFKRLKIIELQKEIKELWNASNRTA